MSYDHWKCTDRTGEDDEPEPETAPLDTCPSCGAVGEPMCINLLHPGATCVGCCEDAGRDGCRP